MKLTILPYCPKPGYTVESEPRRRVNQFGDGYQQRIVDGLNPLLRKYNLTFKLKHQTSVKFVELLVKWGGVTPFYFREHANDNQLVKVVCPKWTEKKGLNYTELSCSFEEVL